MEGKAIFNGFIAKMLVKSGNKIVDLQTDKNIFIRHVKNKEKEDEFRNIIKFIG